MNVYEIRLEKEQMQVRKIGGIQPTVCKWNDGKSLVWSGDPQCGNLHPLLGSFAKDSIHPPAIFVRSLEMAWRAWRVGILDDEQVQYEIGLLFEWINLVSATRPKTDFWRRVF